MSEWAAFCPRCRAGLEAAVPIGERRQPGSGAGRPGWVGLILVVLLTTVATAAVAFSSHRLSRPAAAGSPRLADARALGAYTVVYSGPGGVEVVPANGGPITRPMAAPAGPPLATSAGVAFVSSGRLYLLPAPFRVPQRTSIPAAQLFPMAWPATVGVGTDPVLGRPGAMYVDLTSTAPDASPAWQLPPGYVPASQFLATGPGGTLRSWEPGPGGQGRLGPVIASGTSWVTSTNGPVVAWLAARGCSANGECPLHVTGIDPPSWTGDHTIAAPAGHQGFLAGEGISPSGESIAGFVTAPGPPGRAELAIIDTAAHDARVIAGSTVTVGQGAPTARWAPDGNAVFFSGPDGHMHVYQPATGRAGTLTLPGSLSFAIAQS